MNRYYAPIAAFTGGLAQQPRAHATRSEWYFDRALNYDELRGCLDAPDTLPCGSVRAVDYPAIKRDDGSIVAPITIGVDYRWRE
jgi:hypothetical protein